MLKKLLLDKGIFKDLGNVLQILKDNKGRFSSKRTIAGVIAIAGGSVLKAIEIESITTPQSLLILGCFAIAGAIVILAPTVEKYTDDAYPKENINSKN